METKLMTLEEIEFEEAKMHIDDATVRRNNIWMSEFVLHVFLALLIFMGCWQ